MFKTRNTKKALFLSFVSMFLCFTMLIGTTYAWFTDSVSSGINQIVAGNLDVELDYWNGTEWKTVQDADDLFVTPNSATKGKWEPGHAEVAYLRLANAGTLALKYQLGINIADEIGSVNVNGEEFNLSDYIMFDVVEISADANEVPATYADRDSAVAAATSAKKLNKGYIDADVLAAGAAPIYLAVVAYMPTEVGNEANYAKGEAEPTINLGVKLFATQMESEEDSFGSDYDADAVASGSVSGAAPAVGTNGIYKVRNNLTGEVVAEMTIPGEAIADGATSVSISIVPTEQDSNVTVENTQESQSFDISVSGIKEGNTSAIEVELFVGKNLTGVQVYHNSTPLTSNYDSTTGFVSFTTNSFSPYTLVWDKAPIVVDDAAKLAEALTTASDGDIFAFASGYNTSEAPLTETIVIDKEITLVPNGMYLVSSAPATFTVVEGGKLTVKEGSFTIKNTSTNGAAVFVDGGEFVMQGGSFDAHTAVRTAEGKSSTVTLAAGWSNRVTVSFDCKGVNDTVNVTGGSIYSSAEAIKTSAAAESFTLNMSGGLLSSRTTQYSAAVNLQCPATVNMTGGTIENTYSSGYNGSSAIEVNVAPATINLSGNAKLSSNGTAVMLGSHWYAPEVHDERITFNMSGNSQVVATSQMGFGIRYAQDNCDVTIGGNAKVNATYQAIQFNTNNYVYTNSTLLVKENATITSTAGRIGGGYAIASNGNVTITGGTITGSTAGVASFQEGAVVTVDNSESGTPITINKIDIADVVTYTVAGNPTIG